MKKPYHGKVMAELWKACAGGNVPMLSVIMGVSGSGKSEYAEDMAVRLADGRGLYYAATMEPYGEEGRARVARHRKQRAGKGFTTLECYRDIENIAGMIGTDRCRDATVLLECMSNLLANEMFSAPSGADGQPHRQPDMQIRQQSDTLLCRQPDTPVCQQPDTPLTERGGDVVDKILSGISFLSRQCRHLVVVTNEVFTDGGTYGKDTMVYIRYMSAINRRLVRMADEAVEVVYTVPMIIA